MRNEQIHKYGNDYTFSNFSLLVNYEATPQQAQHIDMLEPNMQFGLVFTNSSPGTLVYLVETDVSTISDVQQMWNEWNNDGENACGDVPANLIHAVQQYSQNAQELIRDFGNILIPEHKLLKIEQDSLSQGTLQSLPGSIIHAGPKSTDFRAVLFFSGCPANESIMKDVEPYHPDTQYTAVFLMCQLIVVLWKCPVIQQQERQYLLRMLVKYLGEPTVASRKWAHHLDDDDSAGIREFVEHLEQSKSALSEEKVEAFIKSTASDENLCHYNITGDFDIASVDKLLTLWHGKEEVEIVVHRRPVDSKIILEYPNDEEVTWEGTIGGEKYTLSMFVENEKFDGSNGTLIFNDCEEIECYTTNSTDMKKRRKKKQKTHH